MSGPTATERLRQTRQLLGAEGPSGVAARLLEHAAHAIAPVNEARLGVTRADMVRAAEIAAAGWRLPAAMPTREDEPLTIAWSCIPPGGGAGGATTMFRVIASLEEAGHRCVLYLHDRHGWSLAQHERTIRRWWPAVQAEVRDGAEGIDDAHAIFATSWETAYPVLSSPARGVRFYLVQDLEQLFYAAGSEALLAEATYRFGFHGVTPGRWLAEQLTERYGMPADHFDFGCDVERYRLENEGERDGVCMYARPSAPRRAFELGVVALDLFAERHPEIEIHLYGERVRRLPIAAANHGRLSPDAAQRPLQPLRGGTGAVRDQHLARALRDARGGLHPGGERRRTQQGRARQPRSGVRAGHPVRHRQRALARLVARPAEVRSQAARAAARSIRGDSWDDSGRVVESIIRQVVGEASGESATALASGR